MRRKKIQHIANIHYNCSGYDTCNDCEPGQVQAMLQSERLTNSQGTASHQDIQRQRLSELKSLKKKYHLHVILASRYFSVGLIFTMTYFSSGERGHHSPTSMQIGHSKDGKLLEAIIHMKKTRCQPHMTGSCLYV